MVRDCCEHSYIVRLVLMYQQNRVAEDINKVHSHESNFNVLGPLHVPCFESQNILYVLLSCSKHVYIRSSFKVVILEEIWPVL